MHCPRCHAELAGNDPRGERLRDGAPAASDAVSPRPDASPDAARPVPTPEEALRADTPPAPCPQCGWSTMWNE